MPRPKGRGFVDTRFVRGFRIVLTLAILTSACYVTYGFGRLWYDWRQTGKANATARSATGHREPELLPLAGQWAFAGVDWNLRSQNIKEIEIANRFETLAVDVGNEATEHLTDFGHKLIHLAQNLHIAPIQQGRNKVYRLDRPDLKAQLVVQTAGGHATVLSLGAAFRKSADEWQFLEFTPRTGAGILRADSRHLLPLPSAARRNAGRFADDGRLLLELVTVNADADTLLGMWKQKGWQFHPTQFAGPNDFSYLCARGKDVVYVWSASPRGSLHSVMLVRAPASADTQ
ncbi:MAG TPA: hypothetical protein VFW73_11345 [Lacipirellulaceae bacterium]|nr:hypothetical protein [Lacipirellulaceae bacterium]